MTEHRPALSKPPYTAERQVAPMVAWATAIVKTPARSEPFTSTPRHACPRSTKSCVRNVNIASMCVRYQPFPSLTTGCSAIRTVASNVAPVSKSARKVPAHLILLIRLCCIKTSVPAVNPSCLSNHQPILFIEKSDETKSLERADRHHVLDQSGL